MKKVLLISLLVVAFTLFLSATAFANNGPHLGGTAAGAVDGGFAQTTDACAGCHRAHTGTQAKLLMNGATMLAFCTSCHDGTGANTNVNTGQFEGASTGGASIVYEGHDSAGDGEDGKGLNAGGFVNAYTYNGLKSRSTGSVAVTSKHDLEAAGTAWGGGASPGTALGGTSITMTCASCHDPHGAKNADASERYRILKNDVNGVAVGSIKSNEAAWPAAKDYTKVQYKEGTAAFCAACHTQYTTGSSVYDAGDGKGAVTRTRHAADIDLDPLTPPAWSGTVLTGNGKTVPENLNAHTKLPVEDGDGDLYTALPADPTGTIELADKVVCLTCHQAHGTNATVTASSSVSPASSSTLLRLNNRGVCQDCHQR